MIVPMKETLANSVVNRWQEYTAFGVLSLAVAALAGMLALSQNVITQPYQGIIPGDPAGFFRPFLGNIHPLVAIALVALVGLASLSFLRSRGVFEIYAMQKTWRGIGVAAIIATGFGIEIIFAEMTNIIRLPADMNVPLPWALLFYPVIGYVVEVVFHALPVALLLAIVNPLFKKLNTPGLFWPYLFIVALLEPIFQTSSGQMVPSALVYIGLHVFAINLFQMYAFRRYGFVSMYSLRLVYYLWWHIIWGTLRLQGFFG